MYIYIFINVAGSKNKRRKELINMITICILLLIITCELAAIYGKMEEKKNEQE
jgi:hypothetical protein